MNRERIKALRRLVAANKASCAAFVPGANLRYFTGLTMHLSERPTVAFVPAEGPVGIVLPELEAPAAGAILETAAASGGPQGAGDEEQVRLFTYRDEDGHEGAFHQAAEALGLPGKTIAVEYQAMRLLEARRIEQSALGCRLVATEPWLPSLRMPKDGGELAAMRRAVTMAEQALGRLLDAGLIRPGRTELEIAADLQIALFQEGSQGLPFSPIVVAGPNSASPHAGPSDRRLDDGDLVILDWGAMYDGYQSDMTRTFVLGKPAPQIVRMHDAVLAANQLGRLAARPGLPAQEVDRAARRAITLAGLGPYFIHRTGHGLGLETHEPPYMVEGNLDLLAPGMTFTVEPGVYVPGVGGVRIEDDVVVTERGSETLTSLPRDLVSL